MGSYSSIITLNVNGLNAPTKRQILAEWIQKQDKSFCTAKETISKMKKQSMEWEKMFANDETTNTLISKMYK